MGDPEAANRPQNDRRTMGEPARHRRSTSRLRPDVKGDLPYIETVVRDEREWGQRGPGMGSA